MKNKNRYPFILMIGIFVTLASCKKDFTCQCSWYSNSELYNSETYDLGRLSRDDARYECDKKINNVTGTAVDDIKGECRISE